MDTSDNDKAEVSRQRRAEGASSAEIREARRRLAEREQHRTVRVALRNICPHC